MISLIIILLFLLSVLSVPVCQGVINGLSLFGLRVFPGLFLSFILTNYLIRIIKMKNVHNIWLIIIIGIITGFPNGSYICSEYKEIEPDSKLPDMLFGLINIPSPAFLISYVYCYILDRCINIVYFIMLTYIPVLVIAFIIVLIYGRFPKRDDNHGKKVRINKENAYIFFEESVNTAISASLKLGAYIIVFSVIISVLRYIPVINEYAFEITFPLEISNTLNLIKQSGLSVYEKIFCVMIIDCFGGLCVMMQTKSVCADNFNAKKYIYQKLVLCTITCAFTWLLIYVLELF